MGESFEEFRNSFSYGSRSDLSFKFLKKLDDERGGEVLRLLFEGFGDLLDTGDAGDLIDRFIDAQSEGYHLGSVHERYLYEDAPLTGPRSLEGARVALLTSSGHFAKGDDPRPFGVEGMTQEEAEERIDEFLRETPPLSEIPIDTPEIEVRHGGYDVRGAERDHNVALPIDRLRELSADTGFVLHDTAYSFTGACSQGRLLKNALPEWLERLTAAQIDVALLVPV